MSKKSPTQKHDIAQEHPEVVPPGWLEVQADLAESSGLSVLLVEGHQPPAVAISNNNSICETLQASPEHVKLCDSYCGIAHLRATTAGSVFEYKCHAGLHCVALPAPIAQGRTLAVIGGRAFLKSTDYRALVERFHSGDLQELLPRDPFANVIFADQAKLEQLAERIDKLALTYANKSAAESGLTKKRGAQTIRPAIRLQEEVERLRSELEYRARFSESIQNFLERISSTEPEKTYIAVLTNSKELLQAERASLFIFDPPSNELVLKASTGLPVENSAVAPVRLGQGITGEVLEKGKALVVEDIHKAGLKPAPSERKYKTRSFISYPITISGRKIGVLNVTDKRGGAKYDYVDLSLLELIGPQVALALERTEWQERATQFQLMSITDPLTGLPNRRYLEERLTEELNRSKRYDYPMSFLMIDIDDFKIYNDLNGHQAGDLALQIAGHCLKASLRSADVASRYGGEEFCILLPQTSLNEAAVIAERIRLRVAEARFPHGLGQPLGTVTISVGISTFSKLIDTAEKVIAAADRALYIAKSKGKNRVELYQEKLASGIRSNEPR